MKKILIVEDVEYNRNLLVQILEDDYEVLTATDGASGIEAAARERPDLILMDLSLPGVDGWEATRRSESPAGDRSDSGNRAHRARHAGRRGARPGVRLRRLPDQADRRGSAVRQAGASSGR